MPVDPRSAGLVLEGVTTDGTPLVLRCLGLHGQCGAVILIWLRETRELARLEGVLRREGWSLGVGNATLPGQLAPVRCLNPICPSCAARMTRGPLGNVAAPSPHGSLAAGPASRVTISRKGG